MSLIKKINDPNGKKYDDISIGALVLDTEPIKGSFNAVTSDAVAKIAGGVADLDAIVPEGASEENKLVNESGLQDAIDNASKSWSTGFTPKGESSVSDLNDLATQSNGDSYIVTDSGTLTDGSLAVVAGDQVAWDATNSVWYKLPQYALKEDVVKNTAALVNTKFLFTNKFTLMSKSIFALGFNRVLVDTRIATDVRAKMMRVSAGTTYKLHKSAVTNRMFIGVMTQDISEWTAAMAANYTLLLDKDSSQVDYTITAPANGFLIVTISTNSVDCDVSVEACENLFASKITNYQSPVGVGREGTVLDLNIFIKNDARYFECEAGATYVVKKVNKSDRFRVSISTTAPDDLQPASPVDIPFEYEYNHDLDLYEFVTPIDGYAIITLSSDGIFTDLEVYKVDTAFQQSSPNLSNTLVFRKMPVDPEWTNWEDVRYSYGFNANDQPIFNTIEGVLESDTMLSVRGGKGRWNSAVEFNGGHVFEGWNGDETFRVTILMGKFNKSMACLQTFSPEGVYSEQRRFGWVKIGSDELNEGVDFSRGSTIFYTPLTLNQRSTPPTSTPDADLNPQLNNSNLLDGTMYYDTTLKKVRVMVNGVWKSIAFEE